MSLVVTGATGFIGARLVARLRADDQEVHCLVRPTSRTEPLVELGAVPLVADLEGGEGLDEVLEGADAVIHVAGVVRAWRGETYFNVNVDGTRNLVESAGRMGVKRFVLVSSLAAAGPSHRRIPLIESGSSRPVGAYGESKLAAERTLAATASADLCWSIVRPCVVYGPGDRDVFSLFRLARRGLAPYSSPRGAPLSIVYVDDVVELLLLCLEKARTGSVYFCSDGEVYTWSEVIRAIASALGRGVVPLRVPPLLLWPAAAAVEALRPFKARPPLFCLQKLREAAQAGWVCSPERAQRELGFSPRYLLKEGMQATAEWYRRAGWI